MYFAQFLQWLVICKHFEVSTFDIDFKFLHAENCSLHLQEERSIIFLILLQFLTHVGNNIEMAISIYLSKYSA